MKTNYYIIKQTADALRVTKPAITEYMSKSFCSKYMKNKVIEYLSIRRGLLIQNNISPIPFIQRCEVNTNSFFK
ncbi:hypothetical protein CBG01_11070 [Limosilactobacillus reuteri]|uniref:Uncharacterized protein n=1 Tax=Limosilactobacillus reuteri TaxID=1598 RepID=A0A256VBE8_LIMRT|nr:hypothetical protein CBF88_00330 [Limosilactobacillus reuteri]OYS62433.1 hypothetical protein CBF89_10825 [Limosilactobacillus reuteri]OYS62725.1 hypothetical protein CBF91_00700 [Limosilactobacillus reuteri]OYS68433.1 hypothetical protein CBG01_11070 [Limosilactobacillus reuteri]OYS77111.1 hypothetical protein CBG08_00335 [Limosilactobacillus reuteri]